MSTRRRRPADDFDREIQAHLAIEADRLVESGVAPDEARAEALRRFGNVTRARERYHDAGGRLWLDHVRRDLRCAVRNLRRYPVAALVGIASLGAGIGATTVTLTIRNAVFYNPPPLYQHPAQLSRIYAAPAERIIQPLSSPVAFPLYLAWRDTLGPSVAAATAGRRLQDVRAADRIETLPVRAATANLFAVLGIEPVLGRIPAAQAAGATHALLSYRAWQQLYDGRRDAIGQTLWIDKRPYTVDGVLPERFWFGDTVSPVWTMLDARTAPPDTALDVVVRRAAHETAAALDARLQPALREYAGRPGGVRMHLRVADIGGTPLAYQMAIVLPYILGVSVLLTLLIACANVAILMIAQWTAREHEIAVRASIGASRRRIVQMLLTESIVVAMCGGALGVCVTYALRGWMLHRVAATLAFFDLSIDAGILVRVAAITLLTGVAAGVAPALYETRRIERNPQRTLGASDAVRQRWRRALVIAEITVTVALLVETSALVGGYLRASGADVGYSPHTLLTVRVERTGGVAVRDVLDVVGNVPGVAAAAVSTSVPNAAGGPHEPLSADASASTTVTAEVGETSAAFFTTLGVRLRAGRLFTGNDTLLSRTAIINETLARQMFGARDAIGGHVWMKGVQYDVVGVVADYASNPLRVRVPEPRLFLPLVPSTERARVQILVRAATDPAPLVQAIRRAVRESNTGAQVTSAYTFDQIATAMGQELLVGAAPLVPLGAIALLLTATGIYGVLAFGMARRSRELAVRVAVGARASDLVRLVSAQTLRLVATGGSLGVLSTFALARLARAHGAAGTVFDPPPAAFLVPVVIVLSVAALAAWIPSRRVLRIDPSLLLRLE